MSRILLQLIKSLSRNEKRYINLNLQTFSFEKNSSMFLSDYKKLDRQVHFNKKKKELQPEGNTTRLYYKILDILSDFHENELPNSDESLKYLKRAKVLITKGMYKEGIKILNKLINNPLKYDYLIKMEALELKLNGAIKYVDIDYLKDVYPKDKQKFLKIHQEYLNLVEFESMEGLIKLESTTLYFYGDEHHITKKHLELLSNENNAFHPLAKIFFNKVNAFLALKRGDKFAAYDYAKRTIYLFEKYPDIKNINLVSYLKSIRNFCIVLMHLDKYQEAERLLNDIEPSLKTLKNKNNDLITELFTIFVLLKIDIIISNNSVKENANKIKLFESEFNTYNDILKDDEKSSSYLNFAILNLQLNNNRQALKYTVQALKISGKVRKDIYHLSLFCELTLHYLLENTELLTSKLSAYKRFISKGDIMFGFEKDLPILLNKIIDDPNNNVPFKKLYSKIDESLIVEKKSVYKPFIALYYLKRD